MADSAIRRQLPRSGQRKPRPGIFPLILDGCLARCKIEGALIFARLLADLFSTPCIGRHPGSREPRPKLQMSDTQAVVVDPPLRGEWAILNPPGHPRLAFDFLATKGTRLPYPGAAVLPHVFGSIAVGTTYAWRQPVFAPLDGVVAACSDGAPDRERISMVRDLIVLLMRPPQPGSPFQAYGGNYVILQSGHCYPLLAHLRCGSVRVKTGDQVHAGDQLGEVGNSGSSIQPHLHFQVMSDRDPFPLFENLLPFKLRNVRKKMGREWKEVPVAGLENGDHLQL